MAAQRAISHPNLIPGTENLAERERFGRFLSAGTLGTILDFSLLTLLKLSGIATLNANSLSFSADVLNDFAMEQVLDIQRLTDFGLAHTNAEIWHSQPDRTVIEQRDHPLFRSSLEPISDNFGWGFFARHDHRDRGGRILELLRDSMPDISNIRIPKYRKDLTYEYDDAK